MFNLKITKMKKLFSLVCLVVLLGVSANVMGQSTGINPYIGDTKTYTVTPHPGNTYTWSLQTTANGAGSEIINVGTTPVATATAPFSGEDKNTISITWADPTVDAIYYLHVTENDGTCMNRKVIAIQPKNNFKLDIVNVDDTGTPLTAADATDHIVCAPIIDNTMAWNGTPAVDAVTALNANNFKYDYGTSVFYYKITASGINFATTTWTPSITITKVAGTNSTQTIETKLGGTFAAGTWGSSPALTVNSTNTPLIAAGAGNTVIWVKVTVVNGNNTPALANENIVDNDFTFTLNAASKDQYNKPATIITAETTQTQKARPDSGVITY